MSVRDAAKAARQLQERALGVLWRQWGMLGASTASSGGHSLVDPEVLVLASLTFRDEERRLSDALRWWARTGAPLLNVTRIRTLARRFPDATHTRLGEFASIALHEGRDFRWRPLAQPNGKMEGRPGKALGGEPGFLHPSALLLRLRLGFGVTVKADLLAVLLGSSDRWLPVRELTASLDYTAQSVRRAADDLAAARLIQATDTTPTGYRIDSHPWSKWLGIPATLPPWRHWASVFAFVAAVSAWSREAAALKQTTPYLLSTQARDIAAGHQDAFVWNRLAIPRPQDYPGEEYLPAFQGTLATLDAWLEENG